MAIEPWGLDSKACIVAVSRGRLFRGGIVGFVSGRRGFFSAIVSSLDEELWMDLGYWNFFALGATLYNPA